MISLSDNNRADAIETFNSTPKLVSIVEVTNII